jgi:hypothetical protein
MSLLFTVSRYKNDGVLFTLTSSGWRILVLFNGPEYKPRPPLCLAVCLSASLSVCDILTVT